MKRDLQNKKLHISGENTLHILQDVQLTSQYAFFISVDPLSRGESITPPRQNQQQTRAKTRQIQAALSTYTICAPTLSIISVSDGGRLSLGAFPLMLSFGLLHLNDTCAAAFDLILLERRGQGLDELVGFILFMHYQGVQIPRAADFELSHASDPVYLHGAGILAACQLQELADFCDLFRH
eukprot:GEMP01104605.1.p1 GENE.GEMP01104605.1~~GEMP01104605.1.p1  ORF type:complete len:181 (-),score=19.36 GEMP01104605.1:34-576(-)